MTLLRLLPRFRRAYRALQTLEDREGWSRAEIEAFQLERLNAVWGHAAAHVPHYRRLASERRLPPRFGSLDEFRAAVPVLPRDTVRDRPGDFRSERAGPGGWDQTSGSTGSPLRVYWSKEAGLEVLRSKYRFQAAWGVDIFDRCVFLWGLGRGVLPGLAGRAVRVRQAVEDRLRRRLRLPAYHLGHDQLRGYLRRMAAFRPAWVYAFARAAYLLALEAEATGFRCDSLKLVTLTAEPTFPHLVATAERAFGVPAAVEYGSVECGLIACQGPDRALRVREDNVLVETVPRADGLHEIVVTVLTNPSFPLVRYAIGDVSDAPLEVHARGFSSLKGVVGRNNDVVVTRTGRHLHSIRFEAFFKYEVKDVRRFRVHQGADGALAVRVEPAPGARLDEALVKRRLGELVEGHPVEVAVVGTLPVTAAGKHRTVTSDLAAR